MATRSRCSTARSSCRPTPASHAWAERARCGRSAALLSEPLADEMTRGEALRWGALLHDAAKPLTKGGASRGRARDLHRPRRARRRAGPDGARAGCARASGCAPTSPRWCATTCDSASSSTSPSRWRVAPCTPICGHASRWRPTSRCCRWPTAWPRAGTAPERGDRGAHARGARDARRTPALAGGGSAAAAAARR